MHELRMRLVILGQTIHLRRNHRGEQTNAVTVHRVALAGRFDGLARQRVAVQGHEIILAVAFVGLDESVLRYIIMRKTCDSHECQSTRSDHLRRRLPIPYSILSDQSTPSTKPSVNPSNQIIRSNLLIHPIHSTRQTIPSAQPVGQPHQTKPSNPALQTKPSTQPVKPSHQPNLRCQTCSGTYATRFTVQNPQFHHVNSGRVLHISHQEIQGFSDTASFAPRLGKGRLKDSRERTRKTELKDRPGKQNQKTET